VAVEATRKGEYAMAERLGLGVIPVVGWHAREVETIAHESGDARSTACVPGAPEVVGRRLGRRRDTRHGMRRGKRSPHIHMRHSLLEHPTALPPSGVRGTSSQ
jgi:hypothetical protein